jgi:type IV fimbrial biogenesis protein FimT
MCHFAVGLVMLKLQKGFTLIELMMTVTIAGIVLVVALPNFMTMIADSRSAALGEDFASALNYARSEAVKRRTRVSLCASSNGTTCTGAWADGFIAVIDYAPTDTAAAVTLVGGAPPASKILKVWKKAETGATITATRSAAVTFIRFTSLGALARNDNLPLVIDTKLAKCSNNAARTINVGLSGLVSVVRKACP